MFCSSLCILYRGPLVSLKKASTNASHTQQEDVTRATDEHPDSLAVPMANQKLLERLGSKHMEMLLEKAAGVELNHVDDSSGR